MKICLFFRPYFRTGKRINITLNFLSGSVDPIEDILAVEETVVVIDIA